MIVIRVHKPDPSCIEFRVSLPSMTVRQVRSIHGRLAHNLIVPLKDVACTPVPISGAQGGYIKLRVLLDASTPTQVQFCALLLLWHVIETFFTVSKIDLTSPAS